MKKYIIPLSGSVQLVVNDQDDLSSGQIQLMNSSGGLKLINDPAELPESSAGVISLEDNATYWVGCEIDLNGYRIQAGVNTAIIGGSSENARIKSTGLSGMPLISSNYSLPMRNLTIEADTAVNLDGDGTTTAIDWLGVNFTDCATIGTIKNYTNVIWTDCAILNSANLTFDGAIGTVGFSQCLFDGRSGQSTFIIPSTLTITRRFRAIYSAFVTLSGETGLNVSTSASIPVEGYILDTINFSGGGAYTAGVAFNDNKSLWTNCRGVSNSASLAQMTMSANATATVITTPGVAVKAAGTTVLQTISQRFTMPVDNRLVYSGAITRDFKCNAVASFTGGANDKIGIYIAKNGVVLPESEIYATANAAGRAENIVCQTISKLNQNDYIEVFIENDTDSDDVTVIDLSVIVEALN